MWTPTTRARHSRADLRYGSDLTDAEWAILGPFLLASDRTSCRAALANQVRLVLHAAASWLMLSVRNACPAAHPLAGAEFATLRGRL